MTTVDFNAVVAPFATLVGPLLALGFVVAMTLWLNRDLGTPRRK